MNEKKIQINNGSLKSLKVENQIWIFLSSKITTAFQYKAFGYVLNL